MNTAKEEEHGLPKTTIINIVKGHLGDNYKLSTSVSDAIVQVAQAFVTQLSAASNTICCDQGKKTINNTHVLGGLKHIGLGDYLEKMGTIYECEIDPNAKEDELAEKMAFKKKKKKHKDHGIDQEKLAEQERLFNHAKLLADKEAEFNVASLPSQPNFAEVLSPVNPAKLPFGSAPVDLNEAKIAELEKRISEKRAEGVDANSLDFDAIAEKEGKGS